MKKYQYKVQGVDYTVQIEEVEGNIAKVSVNDIPFEIELQQPINAAKHPTIAKPVVVAPQTDNQASTQPAAAPAQTAAAPASGNAVKAPLPGTITEINVTIGQQVNVGDTVIVLEAMKMQNNIETEYAGTVKAINVSKGDSVMEGAVLLTIG
ncbi:MAG: biotin/lipoyl-binding protein [Prevotella sp.]|jgi:biotin carboxyl carrier protein|nr:biotin/lipoyl-binding protein [Prevotella sp.]